VLVAAAVAAPAWAPGTQLPRFALEDQHGVRVEVDEQVALLVVTRDMDAGDLVKQALAGVDQRRLDERRALYVADISRMPALVSRLIAIPRMRQRPYRVLLDRDGSATRDAPYVEKKPTVLFLDRLRITRVEHAASAEELRRLVGIGPSTGDAPD